MLRKRTEAVHAEPDVPYSGVKLADIALAEADLLAAHLLRHGEPPEDEMRRATGARELMVRPGGVHPKYGAVDRDYYGNEYDGLQDTFTSRSMRTWSGDVSRKPPPCWTNTSTISCNRTA